MAGDPIADCPQCGAIVAPGDPVCPSCGGRLDVITEIGPGRALVRVVAIIAAIAIAAMLWWCS